MFSVHFSKANISLRNLLHGEKIKGGEKAFHSSNYDKKRYPEAKECATICKIEHTFGRTRL